MSGGSYDYLTFKIEDAAKNLQNIDKDPRRASFQKLLLLIAKAMYDIEWVDSCDLGPGDEHESIDKVFAFLGNSPDVIKKAHAYDALKDKLSEYFK